MKKDFHTIAVGLSISTSFAFLFFFVDIDFFPLVITFLSNDDCRNYHGERGGILVLIMQFLSHPI